jgi:hypothetical protein
MESTARERGADVRKSLLIAGAVLLAAIAQPIEAQGGSDIYIVPIEVHGTHIVVGRPKNATKRAGYDNQPSFTPDGATVLFTSIREDAQADIWKVAVDGGEPVRLTTTTESEYSANATPGGDAFTVIRVEADSTQRLWRFGWDGAAQSVVLPALKPVGYHVWMGDAMLGAFVLSSPSIANDSNALVLADPRTERVDTVSRNIGRAFARVPGRNAFTYAQLVGDTTWIGEVDTRTHAVRRLMVAPPRGEYHVWTSTGVLIATSGSRIYQWVDGRWDVLADFSDLGIRSVSRIAISPRGDRLAFVAADGALP